jgi:hypothetical protein
MAPRPPPRMSVSTPVDPTTVGTTVPPVKLSPRTGLTGSNNSISPSSPKNSGEFSPGRPVPPQSPKGVAQLRPNDQLQSSGVNGSGPMAVDLNTPPMPPRRVSVGPNAVQPKVPPLNTTTPVKRPVSGTVPKVPANPTTLPSAIGNSSPRGNNNPMLVSLQDNLISELSNLVLNQSKKVEIIQTCLSLACNNNVISFRRIKAADLRFLRHRRKRHLLKHPWGRHP